MGPINKIQKATQFGKTYPVEHAYLSLLPHIHNLQQENDQFYLKHDFRFILQQYFKLSLGVS